MNTTRLQTSYVDICDIILIFAHGVGLSRSLHENVLAEKRDFETFVCVYPLNTHQSRMFTISILSHWLLHVCVYYLCLKQAKKTTYYYNHYYYYCLSPLPRNFITFHWAIALSNILFGHRDHFYLQIRVF